MLFAQALCNIDKLLADIARLRYGVGNGNRADVIPLERHHAAELSLMHQINSADAIPRRQHAIKRCRRAAPLYVPQNDGACFKAGAGLNFRRQRVADSAEPHVAKFIRLSALIFRITCRELGAFRHHNDAEVAPAIMAALDGLSNLLDIKRLLRNQNYISSFYNIKFILVNHIFVVAQQAIRRHILAERVSHNPSVVEHFEYLGSFNINTSVFITTINSSCYTIHSYS